MTKFASFGSVSSGTLRAEDLATAFADELEYQIGRQPKSYRRREARKLITEADHAANNAKTDTSLLDDLVEALREALEEFAPPYAYFGAHIGDGADFGYWVSDDVFESHGSFDGLRVDDLSEVPKTYRGEVLHVNDHGNATLYVAQSRGKLKEVWRVV